jgi:hypothetical protein
MHIVEAKKPAKTSKLPRRPAAMRYATDLYVQAGTDKYVMERKHELLG